MTIRFDDRVAIVTGAGGGLGREHALELGRRGAKVVVNDFGGAVDGSGGSEGPAQQVADEIVAAGGQAMAANCSVTDEQGVAAMVAAAVKEWGRVDILINNAGILRDKSFAKMTLEDFRAVVEVHLMGTVICTKAVWEQMREQNYGRILMTSSSSGVYGNFGQSNYGAAKMGIVGFMNVLKLEGHKYNIYCNALAPVAGTRMTEGLMDENSFRHFRSGRHHPGGDFSGQRAGADGGHSERRRPRLRSGAHAGDCGPAPARRAAERRGGRRQLGQSLQRQRGALSVSGCRSGRQDLGADQPVQLGTGRATQRNLSLRLSRGRSIRA